MPGTRGIRYSRDVAWVIEKPDPDDLELAAYSDVEVGVQWASQIPAPEVEHHMVQVFAAGPVANAVPSHGIHHQLEQLVSFDELINEAPDILDMDVVVVCSVNEKESSVEILGVLPE